MGTGFRAVVFDLDGTLYDSRRLPLHLIFSDLPHALILRAERRARRLMAGRDFGDAKAVYHNLFAAIAAACGRDAPQVERWYFGRYMPTMVRVLRRHYTARPRVREICDALHARGLRVAVFSDYGEVEAKLAAVGIDPAWADACLDAPTMGGLKPCAAAFVRVAAHLGVSPAEILFVGDREDTDGAGAVAAGMSFLHIVRSVRPGKAVADIYDGRPFRSMTWEEMADRLVSDSLCE